MHGKQTRYPESPPKLSPIDGLLKALVRDGRLTIVDASGRLHRFEGERGGPKVVVRFHDRLLPLKLFLSPSVALGEAYMDGRLTVEVGTIRDFLKVVTSNLGALDSHPVQVVGEKLAGLGRPWRRRNHKKRARANVAHHYDLSSSLYELFLDADRQYSCAYFADCCDTLENAQAAKKLHLAAKLLLRPGEKVLDIGSGWGGLALELARESGAEVLGITLSSEQLEASRSRAQAAGLADRVKFELTDYRDVRERFDRIVSVGMFEHVGAAHYNQFFSTIARALKPRGVAVVHSIGRRSPPGGSDSWVSKYIFPGSYVPALSEVMAAVERSGLWATDVEILRLHYADTLGHWYERFQQNRDKAREFYDDRFCRMWEFYLAACEMMFRNGELMVFQIQLAHEPDAVPLTRDYITDYERRSAADTSIAVDAPVDVRQYA
jgi:cyclopropane-fatty-acyl-phospholipid synthase